MVKLWCQCRVGQAREKEGEKSKHQRTNEQSVSNDTLRSTPKLKYISVVTLLLIWRRDNNSNNGENVWPKLYSSYMLGLAGWLVCISHRSWELRKSCGLDKEKKTHKTWLNRRRRRKTEPAEKHTVEFKWAARCQSWCRFNNTLSHHSKAEQNREIEKEQVSTIGPIIC